MRSKDRLAELRHAAQCTEAGAAEPPPAAPPPAAPPALQHVHHLFEEVERARSCIHRVSAATQLVRRLHADTTYHTNKQLQDQLQGAVAGAREAALGAAAALRRLEVASAARASHNDAAARITRLQYACTRALYADALAAHHSALAHVRDAQQHLLHAQLKLTNLTISDEECEALLDTNNLSLFVDNVRADTAEARRVLRDVEARHEELARVEASLRELRDMFLQLGALVAAQHEQVESVAYFALQATEHVDSGHHHLLKGTVSRTKARKKQTSLIVCLVVGMLVVLLVLVCT